ncbi:hypothetical protein Agub_g6585, partial [Astrephomene gubernaculifera]
MSTAEEKSPAIQPAQTAAANGTTAVANGTSAAAIGTSAAANGTNTAAKGANGSAAAAAAPPPAATAATAAAQAAAPRPSPAAAAASVITPQTVAVVSTLLPAVLPNVQTPYGMSLRAAKVVAEAVLPPLHKLTSFMLPHLATTALALHPGMDPALANEMQAVVSQLYLLLGDAEEFAAACAGATAAAVSGRNGSSSGGGASTVS